MPQKHNVALSEDDENLQHLMLFLTILFIFMGIIGIITCFYQIKGLQSIRRKHKDESTLTSATNIRNETEDVFKMKEATESSRADMHDSLEKEVEELRAFQREVRGELSTLRTALSVLSQRRQRPSDAESQRKGKTE
jgi:hypothetical protein